MQYLPLCVVLFPIYLHNSQGKWQARRRQASRPCLVSSSSRAAAALVPAADFFTPRAAQQPRRNPSRDPSTSSVDSLQTDTAKTAQSALTSTQSQNRSPSSLNKPKSSNSSPLKLNPRPVSRPPAGMLSNHLAPMHGQASGHLAQQKQSHRSSSQRRCRSSSQRR